MRSKRDSPSKSLSHRGALPALLMELTQLTVDGITVMASVTFPRCKKRRCLFGTFLLNAPFFGTCHDHGGVESLEFRRLPCRWHVGTFQRISVRHMLD